jgi:hypothetical protein
VVFGYIGGHRHQRAKRFNPRRLGSVAVAVQAAARWRRKSETEARR